MCLEIVFWKRSLIRRSLLRSTISAVLLLTEQPTSNTLAVVLPEPARLAAAGALFRLGRQSANSPFLGKRSAGDAVEQQARDAEVVELSGTRAVSC